MNEKENSFHPSFEYINGLDGLRAVSILLVIVAHFGLGHIVPGGFGVTFFFFISGFIITRLMISEYLAKNLISIKRFYLRRTFRIIPAMLVFILISEIVWFFLMGDSGFFDLLSVTFFGTNYYKLYEGYSNLISPLTNQEVYHPFNILWSLAVEEHYYLAFPVLFSCFIKSKSKMIFILVGVVFVSLLLRFFYSYFLESSKQIIYYSTETRLDAIIMGSLVSILTTYNRFRTFVLNNGLFWFGLIVVFFSLIYRDDFFRETIRFSIQSIGISFILMNILFNNDSSLIVFCRRVLSKSFFVYIGKISYSLYLYHWLALSIANYYFEINSLMWFFCCYMLSFIASHFSYYFIEVNFIKFRKRNFS